LIRQWASHVTLDPAAVTKQKTDLRLAARCERHCESSFELLALF
jgi:hypothetical protein